MAESAILDDILKALKRDKQIRHWPDHVCAQAGIVIGKAGSLVLSAHDCKYNKDSEAGFEQREELKKNAIQTAAMAIRFIENL